MGNYCSNCNCNLIESDLEHEIIVVSFAFFEAIQNESSKRPKADGAVGKKIQPFVKEKRKNDQGLEVSMALVKFYLGFSAKQEFSENNKNSSNMERVSNTQSN